MSGGITSLGVSLFIHSGTRHVVGQLSHIERLLPFESISRPSHGPLSLPSTSNVISHTTSTYAITNSSNLHPNHPSTLKPLSWPDSNQLLNIQASWVRGTLLLIPEHESYHRALKKNIRLWVYTYVNPNSMTIKPRSILLPLAPDSLTTSNQVPISNKESENIQTQQDNESQAFQSSNNIPPFFQPLEDIEDMILEETISNELIENSANEYISISPSLAINRIIEEYDSWILDGFNHEEHLLSNKISLKPPNPNPSHRTNQSFDLHSTSTIKGSNLVSSYISDKDILIRRHANDQQTKLILTPVFLNQVRRVIPYLPNQRENHSCRQISLKVKHLLLGPNRRKPHSSPSSWPSSRSPVADSPSNIGLSNDPKAMNSKLISSSPSLSPFLPSLQTFPNMDNWIRAQFGESIFTCDDVLDRLKTLHRRLNTKGIKIPFLHPFIEESGHDNHPSHAALSPHLIDQCFSSYLKLDISDFRVDQLTLLDLTHQGCELNGVRMALESAWMHFYAMGKNANCFKAHSSSFATSQWMLIYTALSTHAHLDRFIQQVKHIVTLFKKISTFKNQTTSCDVFRMDQKPSSLDYDRNKIVYDEQILAFYNNPDFEPWILCLLVYAQSSPRNTRMPLYYLINNVLLKTFGFTGIGRDTSPLVVQNLLEQLGLCSTVLASCDAQLSNPESWMIRASMLQKKDEQFNMLHQLIHNLFQIFPQELVSRHHSSSLIQKPLLPIDQANYSTLSTVKKGTGQSISMVSQSTSERLPNSLFRTPASTFTCMSAIFPLIQFDDAEHLFKDKDLDFNRRNHYTDLQCFAIDDAETKEVDDAISIDLESLKAQHIRILDASLQHLFSSISSADGFENQDKKIFPSTSSKPLTALIYVHIADPTAIIQPDDFMDIFARQRTETIYYPTQKYNMLPPIISEKICSLQSGINVKNRCLTFLLHLDLTTGELVHCELQPSIVSNVKRRTYDQVNSVLEKSLGIPFQRHVPPLHPYGSHTCSDPSTMDPNKIEIVKNNTDHQEYGVLDLEIERSALNLIWKLALLRRTHRFKQASSANFFISSATISISPIGQFCMDNSQNSQQESRMLVEEAMILVGEACGKLAIENNIPVPFRVQPIRSTSVTAATSSPIIPDSFFLPGTKHFISMLRELRDLSSAETTVNPQRHESVGIPYYVRASSPLRRYSDMLAHYQLKALCRGSSSPLSKSYLSSIVLRVNQVTKLIRQSKRRMDRWCKLQILHQFGPKKIWRALVFDVESRLQIPNTGFGGQDDAIVGFLDTKKYKEDEISMENSNQLILDSMNFSSNRSAQSAQHLITPFNAINAQHASNIQSPFRRILSLFIAEVDLIWYTHKFDRMDTNDYQIGQVILLHFNLDHNGNPFWTIADQKDNIDIKY